MNVVRLIEYYDRISNAPDAIEKLRRLIIDLAVRGKLVPQDPNDEPALELLKRTNTSSTAVTLNIHTITDEPAFPLPQSWEWVRLGYIGLTQTGTTPSRVAKNNYGGFIPFIRPADLLTDRVNYSGEGLSEEGLRASGRLARPGSILMVCIGTIGKCQVIDRACSFNQQINALSPSGELSARYIFHAMSSTFFQTSAWSRSGRTTIAILNKGNWEQLLLPLPPLAEQHRIVAKVDQLIAICDEIEAKRAERETTRDRFMSAMLSRLNAPDPDARSFSDHARFAIESLDVLTTRTNQVNQFRETVLNLAVHGKLVRQDPNDEPASELLKRISAARTASATRSRSLAKFRKSGEPYPAPEGWQWARLGEATQIDQGFAFPSETFSSNHSTGLPLIKIGDIGSNSPSTFIKGLYDDKYVVVPGEILLGLSGSIKCAMWNGPRSLLNQRIARISTVRETLNSKWLLICVEACITIWKRDTSKLTVQNVKSSQLYEALIPIPPIFEQNRIVNKVNKLLALCDQLENALVARDEQQLRLLNALITEALGPSNALELVEV